MPELKIMMEIQSITASRLSNLYDNYTKQSLQTRTKQVVTTVRNELHDIWQRYQSYHLEVYGQIPDSERNEKHPYLRAFANTDGLQLKLKAKLDQQWQTLEDEAAALLQTQQAQQLQAHQDQTLQQLQAMQQLHAVQHTNQPRSRLPHITIANFSGDYHRWTSFKSLFTSLIHSKVEIPDVEKFHYLLSFLSGDASRVINHYAITPQNYAAAWADLQSRYDNRRALVNNEIKRFMEIPAAPNESATHIRNIVDTAKECFNTLTNLNVDSSTWDPIIIYLLVQKLDIETHRHWELSLLEPKELPTLPNVYNFLENRFHALENLSKPHANSLTPTTDKSLQSNRGIDTKRPYVNPFRRQPSQAFFAQTIKCDICKKQHIFRHCPDFLNATHNKRSELVEKHHRCSNCLGNHGSNTCRSSTGCQKCNLRHNTLLHPITASHENPASTSNTVASHFSGGIKSQSQVLLSTALIIAKSVNGTPHTLRCLLDQGSQSSFITEEAAQLLRLKRSHIVVPITGLGSIETETANSMVNLTIQAKQSTFAMDVQALVLPKITGYLPSTIIYHRQWNHISGIELADATYYQPGKIDMLLGADIGAHIMMPGIRTGQTGEPMAQQTRLGWILSGQIGENATKHSIRTFHHRIDLDQTLKRFWEQEEIVTEKQRTPEEEESEQNFVTHHTRDKNGRYTVSLPFKASPTTIGRSKERAFTRFRQLEKQLNRKPEHKQQYCNGINEYLALHHMTPSISTEHPEYYLPHHAVIKESSSTTKMRIVFDASAKSTSGVSLNDVLMVGPTIQQTLPQILLRWRTHRIALSADVAKMYRQIRVREEDTHFQKILWRTNDQSRIEEFRLQTLTFGTACAAFLAIRTLQQLAIDEKSSFERASSVTLNDFYVDDLLTGADTIAEAKFLQKDLCNLLKMGGFELRKWISNSPEVLDDIPNELREISVPLPCSQCDTTKTLGIHFHATSDCFIFKIQLEPRLEHPTKRSLLSESAKLFDPLGWLAPVIVKAKIMFQLLWKHNMNWDDKLDSATARQWIHYRNELITLEQITIKRWIKHSNTNKRIELHGFCDASETAFAAVIYVRITHDSGAVTTDILTAKTKVAPIKSISLPRLELCGAVLLTNLLQHTRDALAIDDVELHAWTDSSIVLAWIAGHPSKWKTFVANRAAEIDRQLNKGHWRHVRSEDNPADCASRGIHPSELKAHNLWWTGPTWLRQSESQWPYQSQNCDTDNEIKTKSTTLMATKHNPYLQEEIMKYSSLSRLTRTIATCLRFAHNCRNNTTKMQGPLTVTELNCARNICIRTAQETAFGKDISNISNKINIDRNSKLLSLTPYQDENGLLRVGGRLQNSPLNESQKHPIILPAKHHYTELIIKDAHIRTEHGGVQLSTTLIRNTFWIINARQRVKAVIRKCVLCARYKANHNNQLMGSLPQVRTTEAPPFHNAAIDYAGPLDIKASKLRGSRSHKCWIALFVCMATKAIHIEVVSELTSQAFLAAFTRFAARRGTPANVYSDNGTTFVGASKELVKQFKNMLRDPAVANDLANKATQWHFIPPRSPHFGGLWEAGIKAMKKHLRKVLGNTLLTYEELSTVLASIEGCLNSRPLTPLSEDNNDFSALTPGHFLIGRAIVAPANENHSNTIDNRLGKWRLLQKLSQHFWKRWRTEYVTNLQQRNKWKQIRQQPKVGDMVLLRDDDLPPAKWTLCRVAQLHTGDDGHTRVVTLKTPTSTLRRAVTKICPLPSNEEN